MTIQDTTWGKVITWGYNCEERLRDLRKLNGSFSEHHPNWENMCLRSDMLNKKIEEVCNSLDILVKDNDGRVWTTPVVEKYDSLIDELDDLNSRLNRLCVIEYPNGAHVYHYSYCV